MKNLLFLLCSVCFFTASAQDISFEIQKSAVFKDKYKHSLLISLDDDGNGGTVIIRSYQKGNLTSPYGYYFEHYDADMKLIKDYDYVLKKGYVMGVFVNDGKVNIIEFTYDGKQKAYVCSVNTAMISDFKFNNKQLFSLPRKEVKNFSFGNTNDSDSYARMLMDKDRKAFGISVDIWDKSNETHKLYTYDTNLNPLIEHTFKRDIKDKKFIYESIDVDDNGHVIYLLGKVYTKEKEEKKEGGKYQYELTRITQNDSKTQAFDTNEYFAGSLILVKKKDKIACVGFYSDKKDWSYKGLCYFDLDPNTLKIETQKFNPFTPQFMMDKYGDANDKELKNLIFKGLFLTETDEIIFNAEEFYMTSYYVSTGNGGSFRTIYHYDDIISAKIGQTGDLIWARNINKRQSSQRYTEFISYKSIIKNTDTYFFINTSEKVKNLDNDRIQFGYTTSKKTNLNVIRIKQDGEFDYKKILDDDDNEVPFQVSNGRMSKNKDAIYFIGHDGKKKQMLKITI